MRIHAATVLGLALLSLTVACGGGSGQPAGSTKVSMTEFKFTPNNPSVKSGKVVLYLVNVGSTSHDIVIVDSSNKQLAKSDLVQSGSSVTFTIDNLSAGTYTIFCDLPGHRDSGMEGTLQVT